MVSADKFTGRVLLFSKILLAVASFAGLVGWSYLMLLSFALFGRQMDVSQIFVLASPFVYLLLSLFACFKVMRKRALLMLGVCLNLPLVLAIIYFIFNSPEGALAAGICFAFITLWSLLCLARAAVDESAA